MWNELTPKDKRIVIAIVVSVVLGVLAHFGINVGDSIDQNLDRVERADKLFSGALTGDTE